MAHSTQKGHFGDFFPSQCFGLVLKIKETKSSTIKAHIHK